MTVNQFIEALQILSNYYGRGLEEPCFFESEHDIVYFGISSDQLPEDSHDGQRLLEIGFHVCPYIDVWAKYT